MDYNYYDNYDIWNYATEIDSTTTATGLGVFGAMFIVYLVVAIIIAILQIVAMWKIFTKAGEKGCLPSWYNSFYWMDCLLYNNNYAS